MKFKVSHVVWVDSETVNDWTPIEELGEKIAESHTVGAVIKETKDFILIALSVDPETKSINCFKKIPKCAVKEINFIKTLDF